tara:strand:- start:227 stop:412 length:186 start_codon:yes stop_codon:yes gene_type:complete
MSESMEKQVESWLTSLKTYGSQDTGYILKRIIVDMLSGYGRFFDDGYETLDDIKEQLIGDE